MKVEELRELLKENESVKLRCFDGYYKDRWSAIEALFVSSKTMLIAFHDGYERSMPLVNLEHYELDTPKPEDEKWYVVTVYRKSTSRPFVNGYLFKSKDDFLNYVNANESDFHWIKLEEVKLGELE